MLNGLELLFQPQLASSKSDEVVSRVHPFKTMGASAKAT